MAQIKFSEDIVPVGDLKMSPGKVLKQVSETHRPALLTNRGRGVAVMQALGDYEKAQEENMFMRAVINGMSDLESGRTVDLKEAKKRLRIK
ncbi:MAG TPA: type II toxin-antitoxin system Phd/YefM family antitoxin [Burkholderiales bacterium]|nr:type II toxin-antitoxin system Phd/YefM family antitoxin [Burkholderiales bacterium]